MVHLMYGALSGPWNRRRRWSTTGFTIRLVASGTAYRCPKHLGSSASRRRVNYLSILFSFLLSCQFATRFPTIKSGMYLDPGCLCCVRWIVFTWLCNRITFAAFVSFKCDSSCLHHLPTFFFHPNFSFVKWTRFISISRVFSTSLGAPDRCSTHANLLFVISIHFSTFWTDISYWKKDTSSFLCPQRNTGNKQRNTVGKKI